MFYGPHQLKFIEPAIVCQYDHQKNALAASNATTARTVPIGFAILSAIMHLLPEDCCLGLL
jgi:hypothetical protein